MGKIFEELLVLSAGKKGFGCTRINLGLVVHELSAVCKGEGLVFGRPGIDFLKAGKGVGDAGKKN